MEEAREQLAAGQVARRPEEDDHVGRDRPVRDASRSPVRPELSAGRVVQVRHRPTVVGGEVMVP